VKDKLLEELRGLPAQVNEVDYRKRGYHLEVLLSPGDVRRFARVMLGNDLYLSFVTAVHLAPAMEIVYQFASHSTLCRIIARAQVDGDGGIPTISDIFAGANWHERETKEMFGVVFSGHPCLVPLILPEDAGELKPLLKAVEKVKPGEQLRWQSEAGN
jgi:NADH-quinone oxidoreductase subunit C